MCTSLLASPSYVGEQLKFSNFILCDDQKIVKKLLCLVLPHMIDINKLTHTIEVLRNI